MGVKQDKDIYDDIKDLLYIDYDEPIFILRAQDQASTLTLMNYLAHAKSAGASKKFQRQVMDISQDFTDWRIKNPGKVKVPD